MTKLKKSIAACLGGAIIFVGAVVGTHPAQYTAYAEGEGTNRWLTYPRMNGWEYGSFSPEDNMFVAVPEYGANVVDYMICSFRDGNGQNVCDDVYVAVNRSEGNSLSYYYPNYQQYTNNDLILLFNGWTPGNYTVSVTVTENMPHWSGLTAQVPFTVKKAKNSWTVIPGILSWYQDEAGVKPKPYGEAAYGSRQFTLVTDDGNYVIDDDGNYVIDDAVKNLSSLKEGAYALVAKVEETENYEGLEATVYFRVFGSEAPLAALNAAKESALDDLNDFAKEHGVNLSEFDAGGTVTNGIRHATTEKEVKYTLEDAKVAVYKKYALDAIAGYDEDTTVAEAKGKIQQAGDRDTIATALVSAQKQISNNLVADARTAAKSRAQQYASQYKVSNDQAWYNEIIENAGREILDEAGETLGDVENARKEALSEVEEALGEVKKNIIEAAFENASDLGTYKDYVKQAVVLYAAYLGIDSIETARENIVLYQGRVEAASSNDAVAACYEDAKAVLDGIRSSEQAQFIHGLTDAVDNYKSRYPAAADKLKEITEGVREGINSQLTVPKSRRVYEKALREIKKAVLGPAKEATIAELKETVDKAGMTDSYDTESVIKAIDNAANIEEVEAIFNAARHEIGSALYESRAEKAAELEALAVEYYTDYNWRAIAKAVADGKEDINVAQTYAEINEAFDAAKLGMIYAHTVAELDHYASVYVSYNVASAVEMGKNRLQTVHTEEDYLFVLNDTKVGICSAAKEKAIADLTAYNDSYPSWDRSESVRKIGLAETVEDVVEAYSKAYSELSGLVSERNSKIASAREMLTIYAQNLGVEDLDAVKEAILGILAAQKTEDVPALFDTAKESIDRAADAEQKRISSSNKAAIAFAVIFGVAVAGLGTALGLILYRNSAKKKKNGAQPQGPQGPSTPPQPQSSINYPMPFAPSQPAEPAIYPPQREEPSFMHEEPKHEEPLFMHEEPKREEPLFMHEEPKHEEPLFMHEEPKREEPLFMHEEPKREEPLFMHEEPAPSSQQENSPSGAQESSEQETPPSPFEE